MLNYTLGLDIGIASIGWAVLANGANGEPYKIEDLGVRIFDKAENPKDGSSLAAPRREARSMRRRIRRRRHRKERIKELLVRSGAIGKDDLVQLFEDSAYEKDVYTLRAEGLDRKLDRKEWVRVLIHLAQRRGYRSNSTAEASKDKETGVLKTALAENTALMEQGNYRTVGEMFCKDAKFTVVNPDGTVWRKTRNSSGEYSFTVTRSMVEEEIRLLFQRQRELGNEFASEVFEGQYSEILLSQRNFDEGPGGNSPYKKNDLRGFCTFEPDEKRAFKACYTFEYFKLLQDLNHIRIVDPSGARRLTDDERAHIITIAMKSDNLTYARLRKELALSDDCRFNVVRYGEKGLEASEKASKFQEMQSYHKIRKALDQIRKGLITTLPHDQLDEIGTILSLYKADDKRRAALERIGLDNALIAQMLPLSFAKAGNLSLTAMRKLIPYLESGVNYNDACAAAYGDHRGHQNYGRSKFLSINDMRADGSLEAVTNPVVLRAVSQTCKVVNAIIRKHGSPQNIRIELAREMSRNLADRNKIQKKFQENHAENERIMAQIEEIKGDRPTGQDLVKFKLFREQNEICLYSGEKMDAARLFEPGYVDVDHIVPYSISFDDSYNNKVLVLSGENRQKGNRLPLEYMSGQDEKADRFRTLVELNIRNFRKRQKLLKEALTPDDFSGFKARNLVDTQYIARTVYNLLNDHLEFAPSSAQKKVTAVNGAITDYIRKRLGLVKIRENGDLHHAMDAAVIGITTDGMIQRISRYAKRREMGKKVMGRYVDLETGELMDQASFDQKYAPDFPEPWSRFRRELEARLSPDPYEEIMALNLPHYDPEDNVRPVFVSRMPNRKVTGAAHQETIRSAKKPGYSVVKTPLTALKLDKDGEIKDYYDPGSDRLLYEALKARMKEYGGNAEKAFAAPFHKPKRDGSPGPIVYKVKTCTKTNLNVKVCGGIADNGGMVRVDVFHVENDGYYFVPIYTSDTVKKQLPDRAVVAYKPCSQWKIMSESDFIFSLYAGDLIRVKSKNNISMRLTSKEAVGDAEINRKEWLVYYSCANISSGAITVTTHDRKYEKSSLGFKTLLSVEKYEVDVLGEYHKVSIPEKRQSF